MGRGGLKGEAPQFYAGELRHFVPAVAAAAFVATAVASSPGCFVLRRFPSSSVTSIVNETYYLFGF